LSRYCQGGSPLGTRIVAVSLVVVLSVIASALPVTAVEPHEDPDIAPWIFDGVALFQKYSQALDNVLAKDASSVEQLQEQATQANIPDELRDTVADFLSSGYSLARLIPMIEDDLEDSRTMLAQYRVGDAEERAAAAREKLSQAYARLRVMEETASETGSWWHDVDSAREGSALRQAYDEVQARLLRLRQLLDLLGEMRYSLSQQVETLQSETQQPGMPPIISGRVFRPTILTFSVDPITAFVGDRVEFQGVLSAEGRTLAGKKVTLLLNHSPALTLITNSSGIYQGEIVLPYQYISEMTIQAIYYPQGDDIGQYLGSSSTEITINVLYYDTRLNLDAPQVAYPGRKLTLKGSFDYGSNPVTEERSLSIYQDGEFVTEVTVATVFSLELMIADNTSTGRHRLTLYVAPHERYAPAQSVMELEVIRLTPVIEVDTPGVVLLPFNKDIQGRVYSSLGPLQDASLEISLVGRRAITHSRDDGTFHARLSTGMNLTLLGSQDLRITVTPVEPWYRADSIVVRLLVINPVNIGGLALALAIPTLLGIFRLRRRVAPAISMPPLEPAPALVKRESPPRPEIQESEAKGDTRTILLALYRGILRLVQEVTTVVLLPYHTLREFTQEITPGLGVFAGYFQEFTLMIERLLYSRHRLTEADATRAIELTQKLKEGVKGEGT